MRLRLTHFDGLPLALRSGWYELPSHIPIDETRRFLDLLADTLPGIEDIVECEWSTIVDVGLQLGAATLAFVTVPEMVEHKSIPTTLARHPVRFGLYLHEGVGHWPEPAWDQSEVKAPLVAALRRSVRRPNHPLARLGIAELPIDLLSEATCEPVELLILAESTIAYALRQHEHDEIDWTSCARWSIGRRLANRLAGVDRKWRRSVRDRIAESRDGSLSPLYHPQEVDELVRLGLAHRDEGDALLVPIARVASEQRVVEILDLEGVTAADLPPQVPIRQRATSPTEAIVAFDPLTPIMPDDPWFVDLRPIVPKVREFSKLFNQQLERRDRNVQLAIVQQSGSGGSTMIRRLLRDLAAVGIVSVDVRAPTHANSGFVDLLLRMMSACLAYCDANSSLQVAAPLLRSLRVWLAEHCLEGELREYVRLGADILEHARIPALLSILQRVLDPSGFDSPERTRIRLALDARTDEILNHLVGIIDGFRTQLIARGQQLCLHIESSEHLDPTAVDEIFVAHAEDLGRLDCHFVFSVSVGSAYARADRPVSAVFTTLTYPALASDLEVFQASIEAVLNARAELSQVFLHPDKMVRGLAEHSYGSLHLGLELAKRGCELTESALVSIDIQDLGAIADSVISAWDRPALYFDFADSASMRGDLDKAQAFYQRALNLLVDPMHMRERAVIAGRLADLLMIQGNLDEALRIRLDDELPVYKHFDDVRSVAFTLAKIADIMFIRGELDQAEHLLRGTVFSAFQHLGDDHSRAATLGQIADILMARGELDEALCILREQVLPMCARIGDIRLSAGTLGRIADILMARGDLDEALHIRLDQQLPVYERIGDVRERAVTLGKVADILMARGDLDEALRIRRDEELPVYEKIGDIRERAVTLGKIADILRTRGELDEAIRIHREEELPAYEQVGDLRSLIVSRTNLALNLRTRGRAEDADEIVRLLARALADAQRMRIPEARQVSAMIRLIGDNPDAPPYTPAYERG